MENGLRRLFVFITLTLFIITVISVVSYGSKGISTEQDEHTEKGCLSTLQKMATALDFTSVKEYEHHLLSSGQRLPCGLQARNKGAHKNNKVLAHVKQTSLWSFIFGNLFQDNSNQHVETKKSSVAWTSQKSPHTDLQKRIHLESPKGSLKLTSNLTNLSHAGFEGLNETKNDLFGKSSVNHDRQFSRKVQNSRSLSGKGFNRDDGPIRRANVSESAHMAIKQSSLPDYVIESPKVTRSSSNPRFVREANHQKTVHIQSKINPRDGDTARDAWIAKLRQEAYRLGYALIKHHGPVVNRSPKAKISQHEVNNQRDDRQDLQMDVRNKFVNAAVLSDVKLYKHPKISGSEWSNSSHQNNASKPVIRQQGLSLPVQIPTNVEENAFESKDSVRLQAEARIEKEMHARLRAEARSSIQHFHHDDELKAYQAQTAAMNAINRYANVISFEQSDVNKARFQKLSTQSSGRDSNTIETKIRRSEELRKEAGKAGDEQLKAYGFLHFSDDGIHSDHISDDGIHGNHISNSLSEPKVSLPMGVLHNVQSRVSGLHGLKSVYGMPDGSPASEPLRPRLEWNGRGIPRFQGP